MRRPLHAITALIVLTGGLAPMATAEEIKPGVLRTPEERFENLPDYDYEPKYFTFREYRIHYVDTGPKDAAPVLMLHGEPTWSYLYRKMIPIVVDAGYRVIAPDLIGFGKSDKPTTREAHSYQMHVDSMNALVMEHLDLQEATLFCQDWGGLIGLRMLAAHPDRFARVVAANTGLPAADFDDGLVLGTDLDKLRGMVDIDINMDLNAGFAAWLMMSQMAPDLDMGMVVEQGTRTDLSEAEKAAYNAPFPSEDYKAGPRVMPTLVASQLRTNLEAWKTLEEWDKPFLTAFGTADPILGDAYQELQRRIPGAKGQPHATFENASHFLQEDVGQELGNLIVEFIAKTK